MKGFLSHLFNNHVWLFALLVVFILSPVFAGLCYSVYQGTSILITNPLEYMKIVYVGISAYCIVTLTYSAFEWVVKFVLRN